jgi:Exonuclease
MVCDKCFKSSFWKQTRKTAKNGRQIWKCRCGNKQVVDWGGGDVELPKILVFDIEESKALMRLYDTGRQYVSWRSIEKEKYITGWAAKWLFDNEVMSSFVTSKEAKNRDEKRVVKGIHKLLDKAHVVIAHNGDGFDLKELTPRFVKYGLSPCNRYTTIDTLKKSRQVFRLPSHSLAYLLKYFGLETQKLKRGDTDAAEDGDKDALLEDENYCRHDVMGLEELYMLMRPYMKTHPSLSHYLDMYQPLGKGDKRCPRCLEPISVFKWTKQYRTPSGVVYESCNCPRCHAVIRGAKKGVAVGMSDLVDAILEVQ